MNKTEQATAALTAAHPIANRGHAYKVLAANGLTGSGRVFNGAVKAYESSNNVSLGATAARKRETENESLRAQAHQMSAGAVRDHIDEIGSADSLFWACWKVFKHEGQVG